MRAHLKRYGPLYAIIVVGAALRVTGIGFAPSVHRARPDEELFIQQALFLFSGDWNPHWAANGWPEGYFFLTHLALQLKLWWLELTTGGPVNLGCLYVLNPSELSVPARLVACVFGVATLPLTFFFARDVLRRHGERLAHFGAAVAAAIVAVNVLHVRDSHFAVSDTAVVFFMSLGLWQLTRVVDRGHRRALFYAAAAFGIASSIKYTGLVMLGMLALVALGHFFQSAPSQRRRALGAGLAALLVFGIAFAMASPHVLEEPDAFLEGLRSHQVRYSEGGSTWGYETGREAVSGLRFHGLVSIPAALGWPLWLLSIAGVARGLWRAHGGAFVVAFFALAFYGGVLGPSTVLFMRYTQPLYPALAVLAVLVPVEALAAYGIETSDLRLRIAGPLVVALALALPLYHSARADALMLQDDTRDQALAWLAEHTTAEQTVLSQSSFIAVSTADSQAIQACTDALPASLQRPAIAHGHDGDWRGWIEMGPGGWGPLVREFLVRSTDRGSATSAAYVVQTQPQLTCGEEVVFGRPTALRDCFHEVARFAPGDSSCATLYDTFDMYMQPLLWPHEVSRPGPLVIVYENGCNP
ncbi:MAG: glycosyltransferase family 39 protein [Sandaracinaceae bacterium]|nr:glycosyltransferase family 39 protein [Sandaracinaceae bacterium]